MIEARTMKTIAVVALVFVPASFVAVRANLFLSIERFNQERDGGSFDAEFEMVLIVPLINFILQCFDYL